jgi:hypothetical protein
MHRRKRAIEGNRRKKMRRRRIADFSGVFLSLSLSLHFFINRKGRKENDVYLCYFEKKKKEI